MDILLFACPNLSVNIVLYLPFPFILFGSLARRDLDFENISETLCLDKKDYGILASGVKKRVNTLDVHHPDENNQSHTMLTTVYVMYVSIQDVGLKRG